jgi:hypothetical protein
MATVNKYASLLTTAKLRETIGKHILMISLNILKCKKIHTFTSDFFKMHSNIIF